MTRTAGGTADHLDLVARSTRRPRLTWTVVCAWVDSDGDSRWDHGEEAMQRQSQRMRWREVADPTYRSVLTTRLEVAESSGQRVCVTVAQRSPWLPWQRSSVVCDDAVPPAEVAEVPVTPLLLLTALGTVAIGARRRRTVPVLGGT